MKKCKGRCGEIKPLDAFKPNKKLKSGYGSKCKTCVNAEQREWRHKNPEKVKSYRRNGDTTKLGFPAGYWTALKDYYGERCMFPGCINTKNLHLDHVVPRSRKGRNTLANAQILCAYHNTSKGNRQNSDYRDTERPVLVGVSENGIESMWFEDVSVHEIYRGAKENIHYRIFRVAQNRRRPEERNVFCFPPV